jgi:putative inorganic carbon (HCO3(-)) transporter
MKRSPQVVYWWRPINWACMLLVAPFLLLPTSARALLLLVIPGLWVLRRLILGRFTPHTPVDVPILVLMVMGAVGFCVSPNPSWSQLKINSLLLGVGFLYATVDLLEAGRLRWVPAGAIAVGLGFLGLGLLGTQWSFKMSQLAAITAELPRKVAWLPEGETSFNPNVIGGAFLWVLPFTLSLLPWAMRRGEHRWGWAAAQGVITVLSLGLLLLTQARAAWLGLAVGLLAMLVVGGGHLGRIVAALLLAALLLAALLVLVVGDPAELKQAILLDRESARMLSTVSMEQRLEMWSRAQYAIADFPFTGTGLSAFQHMMPVLYPLFHADPSNVIPHAHNELLQMALDLGLPGLVAWQALYMVTFWMLWQAYRRSSDGLAQALALGSGVALIAHFIYAMADSSVLDAKPGIVFWMIVGLSVVLYRAADQAVHAQRVAKEHAG